MKTVRNLAAFAVLVSATVFAGTASAQTYDFNFGNSLTAQITTTPGTGTNKTVTSITGLYMGQTITGLIADPYGSAAADYDQVTGVITPDALTTFHANRYYDYDNLLLSGNSFDTAGILFRTSTTVANLYEDASGFELISNPNGSSAAPTGGVVSGSVTQIAAVPEPAAWAMMILGMGAVGLALRSAKRRSEEKFETKIKNITYGAVA